MTRNLRFRLSFSTALGNVYFAARLRGTHAFTGVVLPTSAFAQTAQNLKCPACGLMPLVLTAVMEIRRVGNRADMMLKRTTVEREVNPYPIKREEAA